MSCPIHFTVQFQEPKFFIISTNCLHQNIVSTISISYPIHFCCSMNNHFSVQYRISLLHITTINIPHGLSNNSILYRTHFFVQFQRSKSFSRIQYFFFQYIRWNTKTNFHTRHKNLILLFNTGAVNWTKLPFTFRPPSWLLLMNELNFSMTLLTHQTLNRIMMNRQRSFA